VTQATSDPNALDMLSQATIDPTRTVVLTEKPIDGLTGEATTAQVVANQPDRITLHVDRQSPGYVVAAMTNFPGWKARVNGRSVPVERANYAFIAIPVGAGTSMVELYYDPASFKVGVAISLLTLLVLLAAGILQWRWWRQDRTRSLSTSL
jgi:uncharacterized membrane protein YfhO